MSTYTRLERDGMLVLLLYLSLFITAVVMSDGDEHYSMYLAVPYASIDAQNPFGNAKLNPGYNSTFQTTKESVICPQYQTNGPKGNINCLNLNIYVPNGIKPTEKLPVMFYIHGGGYIRGNGNKKTLGPKYLVKHNIIVVTINYRLGIYGYLCTEITEYNNQAIKDIILALKWVKNNIENFGGDSNRITAIGQSAGAMNLDIVMHVEKPLFQRVILQSGNAIRPRVFTEVNNSIPIAVANKLGLKTNVVKDALDFLKTRNVYDVISAVNDLGMNEYELTTLTRPCVEGMDNNALISKYPVQLRPKVRGLDILIGNAFREASFLYPDADISFYENYKLSSELKFGFNEILDESIVKKFYIGDENPGFNVRENILDFASDFNTVHPIERSVARYIDEGANKIYWYVFAYVGEKNRNRFRYNITTEGATHGDELGYLWTLKILRDEPNKDDKRMIDVMTKLWTDFAKYGNPTPSKTKLINIKWPPISEETRPYLLINKTLSVLNRPFKERMAFWDLYYKKNMKYIKGIKT